ncbi:DUF4907 domain-containing protein [Chitinophaga sp. 30R24]|uniref:DUF4907 domain-containing protein n=1 Tax=Chitinophaga sp. 30R24 TaxID=3248838 RepID=UPI003B8F34AF
MTKRNIIAAGIVAIVLIFLAVRYKQRTVATNSKGDEMLAVVVEPFTVKEGWGYKVNVGGKTFIYQDVIPCIPGNHVFRSKEDAVRVGNAVAEKLTHHQKPILSKQELVEMQIAEAQ